MHGGFAQTVIEYLINHTESKLKINSTILYINILKKKISMAWVCFFSHEYIFFQKFVALKCQPFLKQKKYTRGFQPEKTVLEKLTVEVHDCSETFINLMNVCTEKHWPIGEAMYILYAS